jgi:hypothetical protein
VLGLGALDNLPHHHGLPPPTQRVREAGLVEGLSQALVGVSGRSSWVPEGDTLGIVLHAVTIPRALRPHVLQGIAGTLAPVIWRSQGLREASK